ncbi:MAG: hypothetical protein ACKOC3_06850 [Candidatus Limnocylindrus sp.]
MTATGVRFDVDAERRKLGALTAGELRRRYQEIGGDEARSRNREYLIRHILWMLQSCNRRSIDLQSAVYRLGNEACELFSRTLALRHGTRLRRSGSRHGYPMFWAQVRTYRRSNLQAQS